jgi:hypothetical protein
LEELVRKLFVLILLGSLGLAAGCSSSSGTTPVGVPTGGNNNVLSVVVDGGPNPAQNGVYENGVFASATICAPGSTSNCVTVDHLLVDTGSFGLRVLQSEVASLNLPGLNASNGSQAYDCVSFADLSFLWGPVMKANVTLSGETASNIPIQVISSSPGAIPSTCSSGNTTGDENTQATLGANGILGVGLEPLDCGSACDPSGGLSSPPVPAYYSCSSSSCTPQFVSESNQVTNPVVLFSVDNNGVIMELPGVSGSEATLTGQLIFGIGTESNNALSTSVNVYTTACDQFDTSFAGQNLFVDPASCPSSTGSFIDSGSNAYYFPDSSIPVCASGTAGASFYCPAALQNLTAANEDPNTGFVGPTVNFSVDNATNLFTANPSFAVFGTLGGPEPSGGGFDWGLPFFYGKSVYVAIDGATVPTNAPAPWWAY